MNKSLLAGAPPLRERTAVSVWHGGEKDGRSHLVKTPEIPYNKVCCTNRKAVYARGVCRAIPQERLF